LLDWFPKLPGYQAFSERLNKLAPAFQDLAEIWLDAIGVDLGEQMEYIVDSYPIILAKGSRSGYAKVASELCEKSYNSSRKEWYYGVNFTLLSLVSRDNCQFRWPSWPPARPNTTCLPLNKFWTITFP